MKIREGAYYRTRGGDVFGPMVLSSDNIWPWTVCAVTRHCGRQIYSLRWTPEGVAINLTVPNHRDLISEVYVSAAPLAAAPAPEVKTLRDEFAIAIVAAFLSRPLSDNELTLEQCQIVWDNADAMMETRKK